MKVQKMIFTMSLAFITLTSMTTPVQINLFNTYECNHLIQLNNTMMDRVGLTNQQSTVILNLNKNYWTSRKELLNTPDKIGQNTALLACWDNWRTELAPYLTNEQMEEFMQWQSTVDLLGKNPF